MDKCDCPPYSPITLDDAVAFVRSKGMVVVSADDSGTPAFAAPQFTVGAYNQQTLIMWGCALLAFLFICNRLRAVLGELKGRLLGS
jgi:hypothetical protein